MTDGRIEISPNLLAHPFRVGLRHHQSTTHVILRWFRLQHYLYACEFVNYEVVSKSLGDSLTWVNTENDEDRIPKGYEKILRISFKDPAPIVTSYTCVYWDRKGESIDETLEGVLRWYETMER